MTGQHAAPRSFTRIRVWPPAAPAPQQPSGGAVAAGQMPRAPRPVTRDAVAAGLSARRELTGQRDIPTAVIPALARPYAPQAIQHAVIPFVPLTEPAAIYDAMGGDERTARPCARCGALSGRGDLSWRYDALVYWSCPACQAGPEWRSPSLPGLRVTTPEGSSGGEETGILARALLAANPRCVRQRPDGLWMAVVPLGGKCKRFGPFGCREDAEAVYAGFLNAFAAAAHGAEAAA